MAVSIVGGFRREIMQKVTGFNAHITLYSGDSGSGVLFFTPELDSIISKTPGVRSRSLSLSAPVLLKTPDAFKGMYLRGLGADADTSFLHSCLMEGRLPRADRRELILSQGVARHLSLHAGDSLNLFMVSDRISARRMCVSGIFNSHFESYDEYYAYAPLQLVQQLSGLRSGEGSSVDIFLNDFEATPEVSSSLIERLNDGIVAGELNQVYNLDTARNRGANYFAWLDMLDTNVWIILTLMTLVALFTLISGILIIILEKVRFIGVMKAIGASSSRLRHIFVLLAVRIAGIGLVIGNAVALMLVGAQALWHLAPLNPDAYYIDFVPVSLSLPALLGINAAFILIIYLVLILPARLVSRISPSESMRFEQ